MRMMRKISAADVLAQMTCLGAVDAHPQPALAPAHNPQQYPFYLDLSAAAQLREPAKDPVGETTFDPGFMFSAAAGVVFGAFRVEGDYNKLDNNNDRLSVAKLPPPLNGLRPATGNIEINTFFLNGAYDFDLSGIPFALLGRPFVSTGFGALQSNIHSSANDITVAVPFIVNSTSDYIAAMAGQGWHGGPDHGPFGCLRRLSVSAWLAVLDARSAGRLSSRRQFSTSSRWARA